MAIAQGGDIPELVAVLKDKKTKLAEVNGQQARSRPVLTEKNLQRVEAILRVKFVDRRAWLRQHPDTAKAWLSEILVEPFRFEPDGEGGYTFKARATLDREISGVLRAASIPTRYPRRRGRPHPGRCTSPRRCLRVAGPVPRRAPR